MNKVCRLQKYILNYASGITGKLMRGITNVDIRQVALPVLWLYGSAISPARLFK